MFKGAGWNGLPTDMIMVFNFERAEKVKGPRKNCRLFWKSGYQNGLLLACVAGGFCEKGIKG